ncbi:hypothetical protein ACFE04_013670 [Oxalis oulophora]
MASTTNKTILFLSILMFFDIIKAKNSTTLPKFSSILIFGDSSVDSGNNNYISTLFQANRYPYGKDFVGKYPTGRFSNGKLVTDFLASSFGIKEEVPPFLDPNLSDDDIRTGVSFASAGTGYDDLTALIANVISLSEQIEMFETYVERLKGIVGEDEAKRIIDNSLVIVFAGTNDFVIDFYDIPIRQRTERRFDIPTYQDFILGRLQVFIKRLYNLGCRSMFVSGLPPIGCLPIQMTAEHEIYPRTCLEEQNSDSRNYNEKLVNLLPRLQTQLNGSTLFYSDAYNTLSRILDNPSQYGFVESKRGCCGTGLLEAGFLCNYKSLLCSDTSEYVFFDSIHGTEAAYKYVASFLIEDFLSQNLSTHDSYYRGASKTMY